MAQRHRTLHNGTLNHRHASFACYWCLQHVWLLQRQMEGHLGPGDSTWYCVNPAHMKPVPKSQASLHSSDSESGSLPQANQRQQLSRRAGASKSMQDPIEDISLGPLLGQGSHGLVYLAKWHAATIAVKVKECSLTMTTGEQQLAVCSQNARGSAVKNPGWRRLGML